MSDRALRPATLLVVQRRLTHYRVPFFAALRSALAARGVRLRLVVGDPTAAERARGDEGVLPWAEYVPCRYAMGGRLCWQDLRPSLRGADLVVVTQENKLLFNWALLLRPPAGLRVALWGHGRNFQTEGQADGRTRGLSERFKCWLSRRADWWFAYTELSARSVRGFGYPAPRITTLNNAVDSATLRLDVANCRRGDLAALRRRLGLGGGRVGLFLGSLYREKRLDLLLDAAQLVRASMPDFQLIIAGGGPEERSVRQRAAALDWVHPVGPVAGARKIEWLAVAEVLIAPGAVGLGLVEAFAAGVPMVVCEGGGHGPELAYLESGVNGLLVPATPQVLARAVLSLLQEVPLVQRLREGCRAAADRYTLEAMVANFCDGVDAWRAAPQLAA